VSFENIKYCYSALSHSAIWKRATKGCTALMSDDGGFPLRISRARGIENGGEPSVSFGQLNCQFLKM
jgi:hypothetical protein